MATIKLDDIRKTYAGGFEAVKGVSIEVPEGAMCVLVGPSGCGKSTLLRMVAGLETITSGTVMIDDLVVNQKEPAERDIAMVFQNYALYPHMKVYDNMAYGLRNRGMERDEIDRRVQEAARILELTPLLARRPRELSGGQRQRVAMGRAIVRSPKVFLFDEPLSNLDAKLRGQMRVEIRNLQKRFGVTSIYVTHDQVEAMTLADILVVMNGGLAEQIGTPLEIYSRPASTFVASFIGSPAMNLVDAVVDGAGKKLTVGGAPINLRDLDLPPAGTGVTLGIRPEHFRLAKGRGDLQLTVDTVEVLGADTLAYGRIKGSGEEASPVVVRLPGNAELSGGDVLALTIDPGMAHLFDRETGRRVDIQPQEKPVAKSLQPVGA